MLVTLSKGRTAAWKAEKKKTVTVQDFCLHFLVGCPELSRANLHSHA